MKPEANRLRKEEWEEIRELLKDPNRNITKIARDYKINRGSIYAYAQRNGWIKREKKPHGLFSKIMSIFKPRQAL